MTRTAFATSDTSKPDWTARLEALRRGIDRLDLEGVIVSSLTNILYLTGFDGSAGLLLVTSTDAVLLVDGRYETVARSAQAERRLAPVTIRRIAARYDPALIEALQASGLSRIGVEANQVSLATFHRWGRDAGSAIALEPTEGLVEEQRLTKDAYEMSVFRDAASRLSDVVASLRPILGIGQSEREIAGGIDQLIRRAGFSKPAFETIVASGPNGAYPHARPTDRCLREGDLVVLDFGGVLDGYCVDLTRMAGVGRINAESRSLYEAVLAAQGAGIEAVRAGVTARSVDLAAREVLKTQGFGDQFVHGTGHGLGLEVHEAPHVSSGAPDSELLAAGMVLTIEPGAYVEGLGGVRLEDDVLVTQGGREVLTTAPRELLAV